MGGNNSENLFKEDELNSRLLSLARILEGKPTLPDRFRHSLISELKQVGKRVLHQR